MKKLIYHLKNVMMVFTKTGKGIVISGKNVASYQKHMRKAQDELVRMYENHELIQTSELQEAGIGAGLTGYVSGYYDSLSRKR